MRHTLFMVILGGLIAVAAPRLGPTTATAGDLDDGISKYTDDTVAKDDELGEKDPNLKYIILKAKSKGSSKGVVGSDGANMNSAVIGPGGTVKGDIIIIDQSRGDKTQVVDK